MSTAKEIHDAYWTEIDRLIKTLVRMTNDRDHLRSEIDRLAEWLMANVPDEPSQSQGAVDVAIRLLATVYGPGTAPQDWTTSTFSNPRHYRPATPGDDTE